VILSYQYLRGNSGEVLLLIQLYGETRTRDYLKVTNRGWGFVLRRDARLSRFAGIQICAATVQQPERKTTAFGVKAPYAYLADLAYL
jgi:hypothetical protein